MYFVVFLFFQVSLLLNGFQICQITKQSRLLLLTKYLSFMFGHSLHSSHTGTSQIMWTLGGQTYSSTVRSVPSVIILAQPVYRPALYLVLKCEKLKKNTIFFFKFIFNLRLVCVWDTEFQTLNSRLSPSKYASYKIVRGE